MRRAKNRFQQTQNIYGSKGAMSWVKPEGQGRVSVEGFNSFAPRPNSVLTSPTPEAIIKHFFYRQRKYLLVKYPNKFNEI